MHTNVRLACKTPSVNRMPTGRGWVNPQEMKQSCLTRLCSWSHLLNLSQEPGCELVQCSSYTTADFTAQESVEFRELPPTAACWPTPWIAATTSAGLRGATRGRVWEPGTRRYCLACWKAPWPSNLMCRSRLSTMACMLALRTRQPPHPPARPRRSMENDPSQCFLRTASEQGQGHQSQRAKGNIKFSSVATST